MIRTSRPVSTPMKATRERQGEPVFEAAVVTDLVFITRSIQKLTEEMLAPPGKGTPGENVFCSLSAPELQCICRRCNTKP